MGMMRQFTDDLEQASRDMNRAKSLMERASDALAAGDRERAHTLINSSHEYLTGARDRLVRLTRGAELAEAEVGS